MKIAIIGTGISGLTAGYLLHKKHDVTVYEKNAFIGGHTATKDIVWDGQDYAIDTGFIVFNDWTYPNFIKLLDKLNVASQPTKMGFSVTNKSSDYEYAGENFNTLFAQRSNLLNPKHWKMLLDIVRFNKESLADFKNGKLDPHETLGHYLERNRYSDAFKENYLLPMGAAIWSSSLVGMLDFPALFFVRFFSNHGLLSVTNRPTWRVIKGGSRSYITPLTEGFSDSIVTSANIDSVRRTEQGVEILRNGEVELFDQVIFACHSDEALSLLQDPSQKETGCLSAIGYRENNVVLHVDQKMLPKRKKAWSSWNYLLGHDRNGLPILTYNMNILQGVDAPVQFCVTLNDNASIQKDFILGQYQYAHPVFTAEAINAQARWADINGVNNTWFCGAYWFNGFHEDGVKSALRVAEHLGGETL